MTRELKSLIRVGSVALSLDQPLGYDSRNVFVTSGGVIYVLVKVVGDGHLRVYKKTDGSFTGQDTGNEPVVAAATDGFGGGFLDSAGVIHVAWDDSDDILYNTFDTSTDQWGTEATIHSGDSARSVVIYCDSNDVPVVVYSHQISTMGTPYWQTIWNTFDGDWNNEEVITITAEMNYGFPKTLVVDSQNRSIVLFTRGGNVWWYYRTRSSVGAWDTTGSIVMNAVWGSLCIDTNDVIHFIEGITALDDHYAPSGANLSWSWGDLNFSGEASYYASIVAYGQDIHCFWQDGAADINVKHSELVYGGSWVTKIIQVSATGKDSRHPSCERPLHANATEINYVFEKQPDGEVYWAQKALEEGTCGGLYRGPTGGMFS